MLWNKLNTQKCLHTRTFTIVVSFIEFQITNRLQTTSNNQTYSFSHTHWIAHRSISVKLFQFWHFSLQLCNIVFLHEIKVVTAEPNFALQHTSDITNCNNYDTESTASDMSLIIWSSPSATTSTSPPPTITTRPIPHHHQLIIFCHHHSSSSSSSSNFHW